MATNIDPELLRRILAGETVDGYGLGRGNYTGPRISPNEDGSGDPRNYESVIYKNVADPSWGTSVWDTWNTDGTYRGQGSGDSDNLSLAKFIALSLAAYGGANALSGATAPSTAGLTGYDAAMADLAASSPAFPAGTASGAAAAGTAAAGAAAGGTGAATAAGTGLTAKGVLDAIGGAKGAAGLLGAAAGALDSGDKQNTSSKDPWAPAQPFLKGLLTQGQQLSDKYAAQPFNEAQKTAYGNIGGLLDSINQGAGGLMQGMAANASGANQFRRGGGLLGGSMGYTFTPGRYGNFGV